MYTSTLLSLKFVPRSVLATPKCRYKTVKLFVNRKNLLEDIQILGSPVTFIILCYQKKHSSFLKFANSMNNGVTFIIIGN